MNAEERVKFAELLSTMCNEMERVIDTLAGKLVTESVRESRPLLLRETPYGGGVVGLDDWEDRRRRMRR